MAEVDVGLLAALEGGAAIFALLAGFLVRRDWLLARAKPLFLLANGFFLLGAAQAVAATLELLTYLDPEVPDTGIDHFDLLFWLYYVLLFSGLGLVFSSFGRHPFRWSPALLGLLFIAAPLLQFLAAIALFFVVLHAGLNHIARARAGSLRTAIGFFLLLMGQFLSMLDFSTYGPEQAAEPGLIATLFPATAPLTMHNLAGAGFTFLGYLVLWLSVSPRRNQA